MRTNIIEVSKRIQAKIKGLERGGEQSDKMLREIAESVNTLMLTRIHEDGQKADGSQIGTYSFSYLKERQRKTDRHPPRTADTRVVLSLTKDLERYFKFFPTDKGYGLGFGSERNLEAKKVKWNEERYGSIYDLTTQERKEVTTTALEFVKKLFN